MEIARFEWKDHNIAKLAAHGISQQEVNEVRDRDDWVLYRNRRYLDQVRIIGPTVNERLLTIALEPTDDPAIWRPVTAWETTASERRLLWETEQ